MNGMKVLVLGMGLMGPTIAKDCSEAPDVSKVTGCDVDTEKLQDAIAYVGNSKFDAVQLSVTDHSSLVEKMREYDVVVNGTAARFSMDVLRAAEGGFPAIAYGEDCQSCYLCGRCDRVCPTGIGIKAVCREMLDQYGTK